MNAQHHSVELYLCLIVNSMFLFYLNLHQEKLKHRPPWPLVFRMVHQLASGMKYLHSLGVIHKDLKPHNILLDNQLNVKVSVQITERLT